MELISLLSAKIATGTIVVYVLLGLMVVALFVFPAINNRRRMKEFNQMMDNLSVGDEILTTSGIIGKITKINRKADGLTFFLQTGEKTIMEFDVGAIARVLVSVNPVPVVAKGKQKAQSKDAKEDAAQIDKNSDLAKMQKQEEKSEAAKAEADKK